MDNPCTSWLADAYWDNITELDKLTNFHGLMNSFEQYPRDWHLWYTNATPEKAMLPGAWAQASLSCLSPALVQPRARSSLSDSSPLSPKFPQRTCLLTQRSCRCPFVYIPCSSRLTLPAITHLTPR